MQQMFNKTWVRFVPLLLVFALTACPAVEDENGTDTPTASLSASPTTVDVGTAVTLTATSEDFDGDVTYDFAVTDASGADVAVAELVEADDTATFTPGTAGTYSATVTATSGAQSDTSDAVSITVNEGEEPETPTIGSVTLVADPTSVALAAENEDAATVTLTALASGASGDVTYSFAVTSAPTDSTVTELTATDNTATLTPDVAGDYVITATATSDDDDSVTADSDAVTVTVVENGQAVTADPSVTLIADPTSVALAADGEDAATVDLTALASNFGEGDVTYDFTVTTPDGDDEGEDPDPVADGEVVATGNTAVFTPSAAGTYTATATVTSDDDDTVTATSEEVTIEVTGEPDNGNGGETPTGESSFGVANSADGDFLNDSEGSIESESDSNVVQVTPPGDIYAQVVASDAGGVTSIGIEIVNLDNPDTNGNRIEVLTSGNPSAGGFTLVGLAEGSDAACSDLSTAPTTVTCVYQITVTENADESNLNQDRQTEFAYVLKANINGTQLNVPRGYVNTSATTAAPAN